MSTIDNRAKARIKELEDQIDDLIVVNDLQESELIELRAENKALRGQYNMLLRDYKVADVG